MNYAICNETFQDWNLEETCREVAGAGYQGIEVAPFTLGKDVRAIGSHERQEFASIAQRAGLQVVGLHWLLVSPPDLSLTSQDEAVRAETADYLAALVDFCSDLGGRIMVLGSPAQRRIPAGDTREIAADRLLACLSPALDRAVRQGVTICLEPLPPPESELVLNLQEAVDLVRRVDHPNLRTILDVKSASSQPQPIPDLIRQYAPLIAHVHANDANRRAPGYGDVDFVPILAALRDIGYTGYISIEVFDNPTDPSAVAHDGLAYLRRCEAAIEAKMKDEG